MPIRSRLAELELGGTQVCTEVAKKLTMMTNDEDNDTEHGDGGDTKM